MKAVRYSDKALKELRAIPLSDARRIREKVSQLETDPAARANNVKQLKNSDFRRLRVGDYRVIFNEDGLVLTLTKVGHRRDVYG